MVRRDLANIAVERLNDTTGGVPVAEGVRIEDVAAAIHAIAARAERIDPVLATAPAAADRPRRASGFR
jgi:hypothetical protein